MFARHPLVPVVLAFGAGIGISGAFEPGSLAVFAALATALPAVIAAIVFSRMGRHSAAWAAVVAAFALVGFGWHSVRSAPGPRDISRFVGESSTVASVRARCIDVPLVPRPDDPLPKRGRLIVAVEEVTAPEWRRASGLLALRAIDLPAGLLPGDRVQLVATLRRPPPSRYPGGFDERATLAREGVFLTGSAYAGTVKVTASGGSLSPRRQAARLRAALLDALRLRLDRRESELLGGLLLGHRPGIDVRDRMRFSESGLGHLMAVSGLHLAILAGMAGLAMTRLGLGQKRSAIVLAALVVTYAMVAGGRTPVTRSAVMVCTYLGAVMLGRDRDAKNAIAFAALVLLIHRPGELLGAGFQMSFVAVVFITVGFPLVEELWCHFRGEPADWMDPLPENRLERGARRLRQSVFVSACAWIGVQPLIAHHLGFINPWAILANVCVLPLAAATLATGLALAAAGAVWTPLGFIAMPAARASIWALTFAVDVFAALPKSAPRLPSPGGLWVAGYYAASLGTFVWASSGVRLLRPASGSDLPPFSPDRDRWAGSRWTRRAAMASAVALAVGAVAAVVPQAMHPSETTLTVFDGRSKTSVLSVARGRTVLLNSGFDDERRRTEGEASLVIVTGNSDDRASGLRSLLLERPPQLLALPPGSASEAAVASASLAGRLGIPAIWPRRGDEVRSGDMSVRWYGPSFALISTPRMRVAVVDGAANAPAEEEALADIALVLDWRGGGERFARLLEAMRPRIIIFQRSETEAAFTSHYEATTAALASGARVVDIAQKTLRARAADGGFRIERWSGLDWQDADGELPEE